MQCLEVSGAVRTIYGSLGFKGLREIRQNISAVCSGCLNMWFDTRCNQQYFVSKKAQWLEQETNLHIKVTTNT